MKALLFDFMGVVGYSRLAVAGDPGSGNVRVLMYDEIVDALQRCREAGFRLALVSNNDRPHFSLVAPDITHAIDELFDVVVFSSDCNAEKPDPAIYRFALDKLGVEAEDAHYFDDLARNVDAALALGMQGTVVSAPQDVLDVVATLRAAAADE
jgi:epoxide hydrolase-like predicted phosphatase